MSTLMAKVKMLRDRRGVRQEAIAFWVGVSPGTLSKWLAGHGHPDPYQLRRLAEFLGVSMDWLTDDAQELPNPLPHTLVVSADEARLLATIRDLGLEIARRRLLMLPSVAPPRVQPEAPYAGERPAPGTASAPLRRRLS